MIPITRIERYLAQISQDDDANGIDDPVTRLEYYLANIAGESVTLPERPITRLEMYLAKIAGESNGIPDAPVTRVEMYLAAIAGESVQPPEPITRIEMYLAKWAEGGSGTITTVTGVSPLALANALAKPIKKLIQYGKVTTVNGEMFCNNGKLVAVHRSGLPSGYTLLDSVGGSGSQWVITDTYLASTDVVECEFRNSTTTGYGAVYGIFRAGDSSALYGNQTYYGYDVSNNKVDTRIPVDTDWHASRHDFANGTLTIDDTTVTYTPFEFENSTKNAVLSRYYNNSYGYGWKGYVRKFKVTRGNEVICDLLPCKNDQDVAGLYDLAAEKFYAPTGGALLEGNVVDDYELAVVGTPEVLSVLQNLLTRDGETTGKIINADGTVSENASYCISAPFTLSAGNYVCTWNTGSAGNRPFSVFACDADGTPKTDGRIFYLARTEGGINTGEFTVEAGTLVVSSYRSNVRDLTIYRTPQTASVVNLYAADNVKDEQDIISGAVTRRTEVSVSGGVVTVTALAEPVTEQVTAQHLRTVAGDNIVSVVSEVDPVELSVEYMAGG